MGAMSGADLIRELRSRGSQLPIIMLSGNPKAEAEGLTAGASAFLLKSATMRGLDSLLRKLLP